VAASEARRCFHKREDRQKMRERDREKERYLTLIYQYLEIFGSFTPARHSSNPTRTSQIGAGTDMDERAARKRWNRWKYENVGMKEGSLWNGVEFQEFTARSKLSINYTFRSIFSAYRTRTEPHRRRLLVFFSYWKLCWKRNNESPLDRLFWTLHAGFNCQFRWDTKMLLFAKPL